MDEPAKTAPWAWTELRDVQPGYARWVQRSITIADTFAHNPEESIPQACDNWAATKATGPFCDTERVDAEAILAGHRRTTLRRVQGRDRLLVVQDTAQFPGSPCIAPWP